MAHFLSIKHNTLLNEPKRPLVSETKSCKPQVVFLITSIFFACLLLIVLDFSVHLLPSFASHLLSQPSQRTSETDLYQWKYIPAGLQPPTTHRLTSRPNGRCEPLCPPSLSAFKPFYMLILRMSRLMSLPRRCTQSRGVAATTCRPDPRTATTAICRPSPVPAVPLALVAPATCQSNQNDPGEDSGQSTLVVCPTVIVCTFACMLIIRYLSLFFSACQPFYVSASLHALHLVSSHTHTQTCKMGVTNPPLRSKSLDEEKRDRRISWGMNGEEERRRAAGKRRFSQELKRRRHTVAGDSRESR